MARSLNKGFFSEINLKNRSKIYSRRSVVLPENVGKQSFIHNGKTFISLRIFPEMVGHKFGEFALTRRKPIHKKSKKKKGK